MVLRPRRPVGVIANWTRLAAVVLACSIIVAHSSPTRTILCLGDSNTVAGWPDPDTGRWCEHTHALAPAGWRFHNFGIGGGRVTRGAPSGAVEDRDGWTAHFALRRALRALEPDVVIFAYGTNDVRRGASPEAIVSAYEVLVAKVRRAGACPLVALTPPLFVPGRALAPVITRVNALLRSRLGDTVVLIDFASGVTAEDMEPDGIHLNDQGQRQRALVAAEVLLDLDIDTCRRLPGREQTA